MSATANVPLSKLVTDFDHYADRIDVIESLLMTRRVQGRVYNAENAIADAVCGRASLIAEAAIRRIETQYNVKSKIKVAIFENEKPDIFSTFHNGERYIVFSDGLITSLRDFMAELAATQPFDLMFGRNTRTVRRHEGYAELQLETNLQPLIERLSEKSFLFGFHHELAHLVLGHNQIVSKIDGAGNYLSQANKVIGGIELYQCLELQADQVAARMCTADSIIASHDYSPFSAWTRLCMLMFSAVGVWASNTGNDRPNDWKRSHPPIPIRALHAFTSAADMLENLAADNSQFKFLQELHNRLMKSLPDVFAISYEALKQSSRSFDPELFRQCSANEGRGFMQKMSSLIKDLQPDLDAVSMVAEWRRPPASS